MDIGRTVRVFRAEPVVSPVPGPGPAPTTVDAAQQVHEVRQEPPVEVDTGQVRTPVRPAG